MIDLHTHTYYSDGTWSVEKLLEEAQKSNIEILSITDHDNLKANKELLKGKYSEIFKGKIISGVELNTVFEGAKIELLAYDFDIEKLDEWIIEKYINNKIDLNKEFKLMLESGRNNGIKIDEIIYDKTMGWPIDVIFPEIKKHEENKKYFKEEEWNNIDKFFASSTSNPKFPIYVDFSIHYPTAKEVFREVKKAGGKVFIAHIFRYPFNDYEKILDNLVDEKIIDGVEVYHSSFTYENSETLKRYCLKNKLLMSGGSDCHGEKKSNRKIGIGYGNMNINKKVVENWIEI